MYCNFKNFKSKFYFKLIHKDITITINNLCLLAVTYPISKQAVGIAMFNDNAGSLG